MENLIRVKVFEPEKIPQFKIMENTLEDFQSTVGGLMEVVTLPTEAGQPKIVLIVNEEGKLLCLKPCLLLKDREAVTAFDRREDYLCGTVIACRAEGEEFASLQDEDIPVLCRWLGRKAALVCK